MEGYVAAAMEALKKNRMAAYYVESKEEVVPLLRQLIPEGSSVSLGGSASLNACGVLEELRGERYRLIDRYASLSPEELQDSLRQGLLADVMLASSNAVTEDGFLYNVDGNSNRIAGFAFGPKSVILVCGINKIVPTLEDAIRRVKTVAAPLNAQRLQRETYCARTGECVSLEGEEPDSPCSGCRSEQRICCSVLISGPQREVNRIKVILVGEELGF